MTATPPREPWDDARLNAAFQARALRAPATPPDVAGEVVARLRPTDRGLQRRPWFVAAAAVMALVVVLGGSSLLDQLRNGLSGPQPSESRQPSATTGPTNPVLAALGDPITVSEALAVRDSEVGNREIVVTGFLTEAPFRASCGLRIASQNPTSLRCFDATRWVMETPEQLYGDEGTGGQPSGPAFQPSFALVEPPAFPVADSLEVTPIPVVLLGHFHDRRADLCDPDTRAACRLTFVVDQLASVSQRPQPVVTTQRLETVPKDSEVDVDALVAVAAPDAVVVSRQVVPVGEAVRFEPILANDMVVPHWSHPEAPFWIVTAVALDAGKVVARTFALIDGTNWFAEITADGAHMLERAAPAPTRGSGPLGPTAEPDAFAGAPQAVLGLRVQGVREVAQGRDPSHTRDEYAVRGFYIAPPPDVACNRPLAAVSAPAPPCDEARHWLMSDPQFYGTEPGQLRRDPDDTPSVLNPLLPIDVPFEVGETWRDGVPIPQPVIVLGHFHDNRVDAYHAGSYFVIDELVWTRVGMNDSLDRVVRLTDSASEDAAAVLARIDALQRTEALATWVTVADAQEARLLEPRVAEIPEFASGPPIWMVARLIRDEIDGRQRLGVVWAWTADAGNRVWWTECPDCGPDLATSLDVFDLDRNTTILRVFDYSRRIESVDSASGFGQLAWRPVPGNPQYLEIARGRSRTEVVLRWSGVACDATWRTNVRFYEDSVGIEFYPASRDDCESNRVKRRVVVRFDEPIDLDRVNSGFCCG